jgi:hypothetical protein
MNLEARVAAARADLAERLGVGIDHVEVVEARHVTWADSSKGCPQPNLMYLQVLTPGVLARLRAGGREYRYHGGMQGRLLLCPEGQAEEPAPGPEDR